MGGGGFLGTGIGGGKGGGKGGPIGALSNVITSASDAIGLKKPLDDAAKSVSNTLTSASNAIGLKQPLDDAANFIKDPLKGLVPDPPKVVTPTMPDMGQTIGMAGGDTMTAGGEFDLGEDEDEKAVRSRRRKRRGRRELIGDGVGLSAGTSDVGVKI